MSLGTTAGEPTVDPSEIRFRLARPEDGPRVHALVRDSGGLEVNTGYAYVILADHFRDTMVLAERDEQLVGFVAAYRPPTRPETVFVWQVGVDAAARGLGLGGKILDALVAQPACGDVRFLEATVTPDNLASRRLFESFARRRDASFEWSDGYAAELFGAAHQPENLIRVGPFESAR